MPNQMEAVRQAFRALADPTRLAVIERLARGPAAMTELAQPFEMALPSFAQHLGVLESAGLVRSEKTGRVRTYALERRGFVAVDDWLGRQRELWERRLDQLDEVLADEGKKERP